MAEREKIKISIKLIVVILSLLLCISFLPLNLYEKIQIVFQALTVLVLSFTLLYIISYWKETQDMKHQMIKQNELTLTRMKIDNMPIMDISIQQIEPDPNIAMIGQIQFGYDIFLINKGCTPAFKVSIQRFPLDKRTQKEAVSGLPRGIKYVIRDFNIIGKDERVQVCREFSPSFQSFQLIIRFRDVFKDNYEWIFEGSRDALKLKNYEIIKTQDKNLATPHIDPERETKNI